MINVQSVTASISEW